jgi:hypothetical protein
MYIQVGLRSHAANRKRAEDIVVCHWLVAGAKKFHALIGSYACKDVETGKRKPQHKAEQYNGKNRSGSA